VSGKKPFGSGNATSLQGVWWFFLLALGITWVAQLPLVLNSRGITNLPRAVTRYGVHLSEWGPFIAAFLLTFLRDRLQGVRRLFRQGFSTQFRKAWWIPTLLLIPAMECTAVTLATVLGKEPFPVPPILTRAGPYALGFLSFLYLAALEEYGWRGYALPRLQRRWNALTSSLILAAFWGPWHLPQWFMGGTARTDVPFLGFWYGIVMESIVLTWIYNNTRSRLLPVILVHALMNAQVFPTWESPTSAWMFVVIWTLVTVGVVAFWGPRTLTRRRSAGATPE
jgi:membrane protease YdiL (CAAX protease family)